MRTPIATSIDLLDLPTVAEVRALHALWRQLAPGPHRVGLAARDLERLRVLMFTDSFRPPCLGTGAWWMAELPTVTDDPSPLPGEPIRLAVWAYASSHGHLETMQAFLAPPVRPGSVEAEHGHGLLFGENGWTALTWPDSARSMLMLHRLALHQMPGVLSEGHRA